MRWWSLVGSQAGSTPGAIRDGSIDFTSSTARRSAALAGARRRAASRRSGTGWPPPPQPPQLQRRCVAYFRFLKTRFLLTPS